MPHSLVLPLFPLSNVVFFPHTDLHLHVFEPRYRRLVTDLQDRPAEERLIAIVLAQQAAAPTRQVIYSPGTAGQLVTVEALDDGRSNIQLRGVFRFDLERELGEADRASLYRQAIVKPCYDEITAPVGDLLTSALHLAQRSCLSLSTSDLATLARESPSALVHRLCGTLDLAPTSQQRLLALSAAERVAVVTRIVDQRLQTARLLAPFRALARRPELN
jgi:Lon protease-like protein